MTKSRACLNVTTGPGDRGNDLKFRILVVVSFILIVGELCCRIEAKGMARGGLGGRAGGQRTYLKKFGSRSVVYQRKIFNTKYQHPDVAGQFGLQTGDKFKRRLSDGRPNPDLRPKLNPEPPTKPLDWKEKPNRKKSSSKRRKGRKRKAKAKSSSS